MFASVLSPKEREREVTTSVEPNEHDETVEPKFKRTYEEGLVVENAEDVLVFNTTNQDGKGPNEEGLVRVRMLSRGKY
jgi:hypothetical protein